MTLNLVRADDSVAWGEELEGTVEDVFALHRNSYAGMARYAAFLWSGDIQSTWETLKTHVSVGINAALDFGGVE